MIPYDQLAKVNLPYQVDFEKAFRGFLEKGWYIMGEALKHFEQQFAQYHQTKHAIGVANGLDALILAIKVLNLAPGSEIIVPANTYIASILAIIHAGHKPILVEPNLHTYNIDPVGIEAAITPATKAILVVHLYGKCCDMDPIGQIASKYGLAIIEDCAQSHEARYKGRMAGTLGDLAGFSFYPSKNLGALGDAGAILTNQDGYANALKSLRNYGSHQKYQNDQVGFNSRLDELQAIFLSIKLPHLAAITTHKRQLASLYLTHLKSDFILPVVEEGYEDVYHIFNIRHPRRDALKAYLLENGVGTEIHYPIAPNQQKALSDWFGGMSFPISEEIHATTLSLPCSSCHEPDEIYRVIELMNAF